jgi:2-polyprenyl-6-methoxyphenol hydroxylase-like FAD-dependent oxidoreductase
MKEGDRVVGIRARETATGRELDLRARWTVGDDGAHSKVREACGIPLATRLFPVEFLCFGFDWPASLEPECPHVFIHPEAGRSPLLVLGALPFPHGRGAGLVVALGSRIPPGPEFEEEGRRLFRSDPRIGDLTRGRSFPRDFVHVKRPWGHAGRYGAEGAVLIGDAIHPVSPAGGQGANMSVHDAKALADLFLSDHPRVVEEYDRRRRDAFSRWLPKLANLPLVQQQILKEASRAFVGRP